MHYSLRTTTNVWAVACFVSATVVAAIICSPTPWGFFVLGALLGCGVGYMQLQALREAPQSLVATANLKELFKPSNAPRWGRRSLYAFRISFLFLFLLAGASGVVHLPENPFNGLMAGFSTFSLLRWMFLLRGTIELQKHPMQKH